MQAVPHTPAESQVSDRFGRSGRLYFLVWPPAHLHHSVRLSVLPAPPICPMFSNVSLFFFCCRPHFVQFLGSFGGFKRCFWVTHGLPCLGATPLSSPPHPSPHFPPFKPVLFRVHPSLPRTFHFFPSPFPTSATRHLCYLRPALVIG